MKKPLAVILALAVVVRAGRGVVQVGRGNQIPDTGKHDKLNIAGVPHDKMADVKAANATPYLQLVMCPPIAHYAIL